MTKKDRFRSTLFYIATDQELRILDKTKTEKQLNEFWAQFWALRDSDPVTLENEFMDTYLERWQHANEQFGGHKSGWKTDRGRIFIVYGQPDSEFSGSTNNIQVDFNLRGYEEQTATDNKIWQTIELNSNLSRSQRFNVSNPNQQWIIWIFNVARPLEVVENYTIFYFEKRATSWRLAWTNNLKEKGYNSGARIPVQAQQIINDYLN